MSLRFARAERRREERAAQRKRREAAAAVPPSRGLMRYGAGGETYITPPGMFRGTTMQSCGFWPWVIGSPAPLNAVPLGADTRTRTVVCADPISYFNAGHGIIKNPSLFVLGLPGFGKSSLIARMIVGLFAFGVLPMVLGDIRPDYVELVRALGGQVVSLGPGAGSINILDASEAQRAAERLPAEDREALLAEWHDRRVTLVARVGDDRPADPAHRPGGAPDLDRDRAAGRAPRGHADPARPDRRDRAGARAAAGDRDGPRRRAALPRPGREPPRVAASAGRRPEVRIGVRTADERPDPSRPAGGASTSPG